MKRTKFVSTIALLTVGATCFLPAAANAETTVDKQNTTATTVETSDKTVDVLEPKKTTTEKDADTKADKKAGEKVEEKETVSNAELIITTSEKTTNITVNGKNILSDVAEEYGIILSEYRNSKGEVLDPEYKLSDNEDLLLFKSEVSATSKVIDLSIPTIEKESDEVYVGEKKVETEGKAGKALKTFVKTKDLSTDKKVNADADKTEEKAASTEVSSLTVLVKPEAKVVLIGTKEKPAPAPVEEIEETVDEDSTTDNSSEETTERDPISGEPLNVDTVVEEDNDSASASNSSANDSGTSSRNYVDTRSGTSVPNGVKTQASSTAPNSIVKSEKTRGQKAVDLAYTRLGSDYNWASSGERAFDCSGLIYWIYNKNLGVDIPRTAKQQGSSAQQIPLSDLEPGDLLWTNSHIGMYIGDGKMIHASRSNDEVVVSGIGWFVDSGAKGARIR